MVEVGCACFGIRRLENGQVSFGSAQSRWGVAHLEGGGLGRERGVRVQCMLPE